MLAVLLAIMLVTGAVISQTEKKVRATYSRLAEEQFDEQAERFLDIRKFRIETVAASVERLAATPQLRKVFEDGDFSRKTLDDIEQLGRNRPGAQEKRKGGKGRADEDTEVGVGKVEAEPANATERLIFLVDLEGSRHQVTRGAFEVPRIANEPLRHLDVAEDLRTRQVGYLVASGQKEDGANAARSEPQLVEVIVAPVTRGGEGDSSGEPDELLGAVLMGQLVDLSGNERRSDPAQAPRPRSPAAVGEGGGKGGAREGILGGGRRRLFAGILADGVLFKGTLPDGSLADVEALLEKQLGSTESSKDIDFDDELILETGAESTAGVAAERKHFRLFCERLNPGGVLPPAYQVVLIPMSQLHADLRDLRLRGSEIGGFAAMFGLLLAWIFSRRLARPIHDLAHGTEQVRQGNFRARVPVRSEDEFGQLAESFNEMAGELEVKEQIRDLLGKVSDEAVAQALISGRLELGGETREVSILFCDIRGFTAMTETMKPGDVISLLNEHMTAMTEVVYEHNGVIDKFVGDEIMVIFGAPKRYGDDAGNAARCALKMIERRHQLSAETGREIEVGIGVATGDVVVGCMGSTDRLNYTVIGERVNRAARLCSCAEAGEVVVDESTWNEIAAAAEGAERLRFKPKGYTRSVRAFRLDAMREDAATVAKPVDDSAPSSPEVSVE